MPGPVVPEVPQAPPPKTDTAHKPLPGGWRGVRNKAQGESGREDPTKDKDTEKTPPDTANESNDERKNEEAEISLDAKAGIDDPPSAHGVLLKLAARAKASFDKSRFIERTKRTKKGKKVDIHKSDEISKKIDNAEEGAKDLYEQMLTLTESEIPEDKAMGYDFLINNSGQELLRAQVELDKLAVLRKQHGNLKEIDDLENPHKNDIDRINEEIVKLKKEREEVKDAKGADIPDQIIKLANELTKGQKLSDQESEQLKADPLSMIMTKIGEGLKTQDGTNELVDTLSEAGFVDSDKKAETTKFLDKLREGGVSDTDLKDIDVWKLREAGKTGGLLALLVAYLVSKAGWTQMKAGAQRG